MKVFLDTEFTDFVRPRLISLGMVADSGDEFYAEIPYEREECSDFVLETVVPLLGKNSTVAMSKNIFSNGLRAWLQKNKELSGNLEVCFDSQIDWDLFIEALNYQVPEWCKGIPIAFQIDEEICLEFLKQKNLPAHHALNDAHANQYAYLKFLESGR